MFSPETSRHQSDSKEKQDKQVLNDNENTNDLIRNINNYRPKDTHPVDNRFDLQKKEPHQILYRSSQILQKSKQIREAFSKRSIFRKRLACYTDRLKGEQKAIEAHYYGLMRSFEDFVSSQGKTYEKFDSGFEQLDSSLSNHEKTLQAITDEINKWLKELIPTQSFQLSYRDLDCPQQFARPLSDMLFDRSIAPDVQGKMARTLGQLQEKAVVGRLTEALSHPNVDQAIHNDISVALAQLADSSHASHAPALTEKLFDRRLDFRARWVTANIIGKLQNKAVVGRLSEALSHPNVDWVIHYDISRALDQLADSSHAQALTDALLHQRIAIGARNNVANIIGKLQNKAVVGRLSEALSHPNVSWEFHYPISLALEQLADRSHAHTLTEKLFDPRIDVLARRRIARRLGQLQEKAVAGRLSEALSHPDVDQSIHYDISQALEHLRS